MAAPPKLCPTKRRTTTTITTVTKRRTTTTTLLTAITKALTSSHTFLNTHDLTLLPSHSLSLQSSLSSSLLSLSKLQQQQQPYFPLSHHPSTTSSPCWFQRFIDRSCGNDNDIKWIDFFRMSKPTFYCLNSIISDSIKLCVSQTVSPHFALGAAIYRLAHNGLFSVVGKKFGMSSADACRAFYGVCKIVCDKLGGLVGGFGCDLGRVLAGFERISLVNCCGVLGVEKFDLEGEMLGENGYLLVQVLVDCDGKFLDVSAGWPSTFEPVSVLQQTRLFVGVEESKEMLNGPKLELIDGNLVPQYVLGDCCYPCLPWLLTPFGRRGDEEELSASEKEFNEVHKRAMGCVRTAFRRVRENWKLLDRRWKEESVEFLPFIIVSACVLNNFLMKHGELSDDDHHSSSVVEHDMPEYSGEVDEGAARNRDMLALHLSRVKQDK